MRTLPGRLGGCWSGRSQLPERRIGDTSCGCGELGREAVALGGEPRGAVTVAEDACPPDSPDAGEPMGTVTEPETDSAEPSTTLVSSSLQKRERKVFEK